MRNSKALSLNLVPLESLLATKNGPSFKSLAYLECDVDGGLLLVDLERLPVSLGRVADDDVGLALAVGLGDADGVLEGLAAVAVHHDLVLVRGDQSERKRTPGLGFIRR